MYPGVNSRNQVIFLWLPTCILLNFQVDMMWQKFAKLSRPEIYTITLHFRDGKILSWKKYSSKQISSVIQLSTKKNIPI